MKYPILISLITLSASILVAPAQVLAKKPAISIKIDQLANDLIKKYKTPGIAVAVVKGGKNIHVKGYGKRLFNAPEKVDKNTYFRIASASKAFTAASLARFVDEGKLHWDDKVIEHLPEFQLADPWVTREFTIRDLLTHRSGLGSGAGDLMLWPAPAGFTRQEIIHNLRYLKPVSSFRSEYAYDNLLYIVAGEIISKISGLRWEDYIQQNLLSPMGDNCYAEAPEGLQNVATPHQIIEGKMGTVLRNAVTGSSPVYAAAGGISCTASGLADWMSTWLSGGLTPQGDRLFSQEQRDEMWQGVTLMRPTRFEKELLNAHFKTYALAWRKLDAMGYEFISHTGSLSGARAWVAFLPALEVGIAILDNGNNSKVRNILMTALLAEFTKHPRKNWIKHIDGWYEQQKQASKADEAEGSDTALSGTVFLPIDHYAGAYKDNWFGWVDIKQQDESLRFVSRKSHHMKGTLEPAHGNTFIVRWDDRSFEADAWVQFESDFDGKIIGMKMKAVSSDTDSSFDFQDLAFTRQSE